MLSYILSLLTSQKGLPKAHSAETQPQLKRHSRNCTFDYSLTQNKLEMTAGSTKKLYHLPAKLIWTLDSFSWKKNVMHLTRGLLKTATLWFLFQQVLRCSCYSLSFSNVFYPRVATLNYTGWKSFFTWPWAQLKIPECTAHCSRSSEDAGRRTQSPRDISVDVNSQK